MTFDELLEPAYRLKQAGDPDGASSAIDALIEEHADDPRVLAHLRIEQTRDYQGGPDPAREALRTALDQGWDDLASRALSAIVVCLSMKGKGSDDLARSAERARSLAGDDPELLGLALDASARLAANQGRRQEAMRLWTEAVWLHESCGYRIGVARHLYRIGRVFQWQGALAEAADFYDRAEEGFAQAGDVIGAANVLRAMAENAVSLGQLVEAEQLVRRCISLEKALKRGRGLCTALNALGEVLRTRGDLQAAEAAYKQALEVQDNPFARMNLALCLQARDRHEEAREALRGVLVAADAAEQVSARCLLLPSLAALGDVDAWRDQFPRTQALLGVTRVRDPDLAQCLEGAGDHWSTSGGPDAVQRAVRSYRLAAQMWDGLGKKESAERCRAAIQASIDAGCRPLAGPWDLQERLGRGSMGSVWRARHQQTSDDAALKLLNQRDPSPRLMALVEAEARAVARLDHANIVRLVGYGALDEVSARVADMAAGTPWFATELATGGTLLSRCGDVSWSEAHAYLLQLLSALGHAHAHGLVHLDVKPENVLLHDGRPRLADFGVAAALQLLGGRVGRVGTPWYMAPEQFDQRYGYSPQTDLYALGCLAIHLLSGAPPYHGDDPSAQERAHLAAPFPEVDWPADVPAAFDGWVSRLLAKLPAERFQRAADAAWALEQIPAEHGVEREPRRPGFHATSTTWNKDAPRGEGLPVAFSAATPTDLPPLRLAHLDTYTPPPCRAPEILAWRPLPVVGREREQELVWATLREVAWGSPRGVVLEGPDTLGRDALARWICARAHEVGAAEVLRAEAGAPPVEAMLSQLMQPPASLEVAEAAVAQLWPELEPDARHALALAATGAPSVEAPAAMVRALQRSKGRRVIVHLVGEGTVPLAEALLESGAAVLVLLEVEALGTLSEELLDRGDCVPLSLEPLEDPWIRGLCDRMLPMSARLASDLASRASGHPALAADVLYELVAEKALGLVDGRWALMAGAQVPELGSDGELPGAVGREGEDCTVALAALAGLRRPVDDAVWAELCALDAATAASLAERLTGAGVVRWSPSGLALVHPELKPALWREARGAGRLGEALQRAAKHATTDALRGELLLEGGRPREAVEYLLRAARDDLRTAPGQVTSAQRLLSDAVRLGGLPRTHPLALDAALLRVEQRALADELDEAEKLLRDLPELPRGALGARARTVGVLALKRGELRQAVDHLHTARVIDADDSDASFYLGHALTLQGRPTEAEEAYRAAIQGRAGGEAVRTNLALAGLSRAQGRYDEAMEQLNTAWQEAQNLGRSRAAAVAWMGLGNVHQHRGQYADAADAFLRAERLLERGDRRWALLRLNRALLAVAQGEDERASMWLDEVDRIQAAPAARRHVTLVRLALAAKADHDTFATWSQQAAEAIAESADPDYAHCLELAASRASDIGAWARARGCLRGAHDVWERLGRHADGQRVQELLEAMPHAG